MPPTRLRNKRKKRARAQARRDDSVPQISNWIVAFMDLLGYRKVLEAMDVFPFPVDDQGIAMLRDAANRAKFVRTQLHDTFRQFISGLEEALPVEDDFPNHLRQIAEEISRVRILNSPGPDHFILEASLTPAAGHSPIRAVYSVLAAAAATMLNQLALGGFDLGSRAPLPLRGGIDIAPGFLDAHDNFLYSPAMASAYELELCADYPRTLVGIRVPQFLESVAGNSDRGLVADVARITAEEARKMIFEDMDGKLALDFYGDKVREFYTDDLAAEYSSRAWQFVERTIQEMRARGDLKLLRKYEYLFEYMTPRRVYWP